MADKFKVGDTVRRKSDTGNNEAYEVGNDPFVIQDIVRIDRIAYAVDANLKRHGFDRLEMVTEEDRIIPAAEKGKVNPPELWYAGDKVKLTGAGFREDWLGLYPGMIVTLEKANSVGGWTILEGDRDANRGPIHVVSKRNDFWGAELVEKSSPHRPEHFVNEVLASSGEVRTTSSTGGQKGVKPEAYALIPFEAMDEIARVYNAGAEKYAAHNWRKGYEWSKSFSAACRHLFAFWRGEDRDPELGTLHLANAAFHILAMITFSLNREKYGEYDDRYTEAPADSDG